MSQSESFSSQDPTGWINWYCSLQDNQFFCKIDQEYITDNFNLFGLKQSFQNYNQAMQMILRSDKPKDTQLDDQRFASIYQQATDLYGLIHARYILTPKGLAFMKQKYLKGNFGNCPRVLCQKQNVLPIGMCQDLRISRVKIYCPRCEQVYLPNKKCNQVDGAYFGCSFPNVFLLSYPDLCPKPPSSKFIPKVYGFKIYGKKGSKYEQINQKKQITHYTEQQLKRLKERRQHKKL